jgi:pimeloyl-ACP methyl ester carboxylesterase
MTLKLGDFYMIEALRTPDERFKSLPNFPYDPKYLINLPGYEGLRVHFIDTGPPNVSEVFLCLHGQPTWSFLYRKMIPIFTSVGCRVIAPDFFGFGRSDKPMKKGIYTFDFHRNFLIKFIEILDLNNITLVCQDWGGILGLTLPMEFPERFKRLFLMNTIIATGEWLPTPGFIAFRDWVNHTEDIKVSRLMKRAVPDLTLQEAEAYDAPFPAITYKVGVKRFPNILPLKYKDPGANISRKARDWFKKQWKGSSFMAIGMQDPVLGSPMMRILRKMIPNCPKPFKLRNAGHFVQEWGEIIAYKALEHFKLI